MENMRRLFLTAFVLLAISNVQANDAGLINTAKTQIKDNIDDPFSAQFRKVRVVTNLDGKKSVCGEINYKNQYGAYKGFVPFLYTYDKLPFIRSAEYGALVYMYDLYYVSTGCGGKELELAEKRKREEAERQKKLREQEKLEQERLLKQKKEEEERVKKEKAEQVRLEAERQIEAKQKYEQAKVEARLKKESMSKIEIKQHNELVTKFCNFAYDYYVNRVANGFGHEQAFSNIQTIHKNLNLEPVVGTLKSVEETLNNGMIEIEKNDFMQGRLKNNGAFFQGFVKGTCLSKYKL